MKTARLSIGLLLVCALASTASAQPRGGHHRGDHGPGGFGMMGDMSPLQHLTDAVKKLDLSSEQKDKIEAIKKEYEPKFKAIHEKREKILTDDQKKAMADAMKEAREAKGDDRREAYKKVREAGKLTDDQKKAMGDVMKETGDLIKEVRPKVMDVLTDDQKDELKKSWGRGFGGGHGHHGDKGDKKDAPKEKEST